MSNIIVDLDIIYDSSHNDWYGEKIESPTNDEDDVNIYYLNLDGEWFLSTIDISQTALIKVTSFSSKIEAFNKLSEEDKKLYGLSKL